MDLSRKINIRLRRTVVISLVLFSIIITSGELFFYKNSIKRDVEHVGIVSLIRDVESALLRTWILGQNGYEIHSKDSLNLLHIQLKGIERNIRDLELYLNEYKVALQQTEFKPVYDEFEKIKSKYLVYSDLVLSTMRINDKFSQQELERLFEDLDQNFEYFVSLIPEYIARDKKRYQEEILFVTLLNIMIIILAGIVILRFARKFELAERKLIIGTIEVENRERERIAADLHDGIGALLSGLIIHIQVLKKEHINDEELMSRFEQIHLIAADALSGLEETIYNLNPPILTRFGLHGSLERLIKRINTSDKTEFQFRSGILDEKFEQGTELLVFRICNELINNTLKHSNADTAILEIESTRKVLLLTFMDNGDGFEYNMDKIRERKSGINNIIQRVESINGRWAINTELGLGVQVYIVLPLTKGSGTKEKQSIKKK